MFNSMARKVFISFLGTTNYLETYYQIEEKKYGPVRFVQEALADHICSNWTSEDKIFIFYTTQSSETKELGSYELNWLDNGQSKAVSEIETKGLQGILKSKPYASLVESYEIKEGFSENDVWDIFNVVYDKLKQNDEIYFDVTHAFRSIPMFSTVLFNFSQFMKQTKLISVHYGAFEKLGPAYKVKTIPLEQRIAPILDLTSIIQLQNVTQIASDFSNFGKVSGVGHIFNARTEDKSINLLVSRLRNETSKLDDYILTNKIDQIKKGDFVKDIMSQINNIRERNAYNHAQNELLNKLEESISKFTPNGGDNNIIQAVLWSLKYNMIQQAYTLAEEYLISKVCDLLKLDNKFEEQLTRRNFISKIMSISKNDIKNKSFKEELNIDKEFTKDILNNNLIIEIRKIFPKISSNRNILCHAKKTELTAKKFKQQLEKNFLECCNYIESYSSL